MTGTEINHTVISLEEFKKDTKWVKLVATTQVDDCIISTALISAPFGPKRYEICVKFDESWCVSCDTYAEAVILHTEMLGRVLTHGQTWELHRDVYSPQQYHYIGEIQKQLNDFDEADMFTFDMIA